MINEQLNLYTGHRGGVARILVTPGPDQNNTHHSILYMYYSIKVIVINTAQYDDTRITINF